MLFDYFLLYLYFDHRLTAREKEEREHKKQLLQIAKEHEKARELERIQRYHMPRDIKKGETGQQKIFANLNSLILTVKLLHIIGEYIEVDEREKLPHHEQKKWEQEQMASAVYKFGSRGESKNV